MSIKEIKDKSSLRIEVAESLYWHCLWPPKLDWDWLVVKKIELQAKESELLKELA